MKKVINRTRACIAVFAIGSVALAAAAQTAKSAASAAQATPVIAEVPEKAVSVTNQPVQMRKNPPQTGLIDKKIGSSQGLGQFIPGVDNSPSSGSSAQSTVDPNIQVSFAINPTGTVWTFSADVALPAAAWKISCANTTSFFNNAFGQPVSDDVISISQATVVMLGSNAVVSCGYKTSAHALNIAKSVDAIALPNINNFSFGNTIYTSPTIAVARKLCTRASKIDNFSCS